MTQLEFQKWADRTRAALDQVRSAIEQSPSSAVRALAERLPDPASASDDPISLAFAGQYSAGKSTIISALTGRDDIATGAGITTERTHRYDWHDVVITDTPGIHTTLRPDHDNIAYEAIAAADLLVFVITNELFDSHIAQHYRKLTIDQGKGHETILVVNKMGRHAEGNVEDSRAVITEALREPLAPFTPEELRVTFTDAAGALDAAEETDPEFREMLEQQGNLGELVANLDSLVRDKGLTARLTTTLYQADHVLQDTIALEPTEDPDSDALILVYNQNIRAINSAMAQIRLVVDAAIAGAESTIIQAGDAYAQPLYPGVTQHQMEAAAEEADSRCRRACEDLGRDIECAFTEVIPELAQRIHEMQQGDLYQQTAARFTTGVNGGQSAASLQSALKGLGLLGDLGKRFAINHSAVAAGASGMARFSGSAAHGAILNIGHFFGYSFRPWQAVRYAGFIGRAAPFVSIAVELLSITAQIRADRAEDRRSEEACRKRDEIRLDYSRMARDTGQQARARSEETIDELLAEPLRQIIASRDELNALREGRNISLSRLNAASLSVRNLITQIHDDPVQDTSEPYRRC